MSTKAEKKAAKQKLKRSRSGKRLKQPPNKIHSSKKKQQPKKLSLVEWLKQLF